MNNFNANIDRAFTNAAAFNTSNASAAPNRSQGNSGSNVRASQIQTTTGAVAVRAIHPNAQARRANAPVANMLRADAARGEPLQVRRAAFYASRNEFDEGHFGAALNELRALGRPLMNSLRDLRDHRGYNNPQRERLIGNYLTELDGLENKVHDQPIEQEDITSLARIATGLVMVASEDVDIAHGYGNENIARGSLRGAEAANNVLLNIDTTINLLHCPEQSRNELQQDLQGYAQQALTSLENAQQTLSMAIARPVRENNNNRVEARAATIQEREALPMAQVAVVPTAEVRVANTNNNNTRAATSRRIYPEPEALQPRERPPANQTNSECCIIS